ncbi:MAG: metallophosphoesterase [Cypionkella sp.]|nr:metallophosphoesterase [Cypionkella sp.]MDZ4309644.1 metallophosphoesterase [Cypionkella sp.]
MQDQLQVLRGLCQAPPTPHEPVCLVGDIHGRADLLVRFMTLRQRHFPHARLVILGDMIDRGENSAEVLALLRNETTSGAVCIAGNHEAMLLAFLDDPTIQAKRWLAHGGLETLASFGLRGIPRDAADHQEIRDHLRAALGCETEAWLRRLPYFWRSGDLVVVHAALDPARPIKAQRTEVLTWGHPDFDHIPRKDGIWVAHGHVVVERAFARSGRIALDTGAYATGRLSYALIDPAMADAERITLGVTP